MPDPVLDEDLRRALRAEVDRLLDGARAAAEDGKGGGL